MIFLRLRARRQIDVASLREIVPAHPKSRRRCWPLLLALALNPATAARSMRT